MRNVAFFVWLNFVAAFGLSAAQPIYINDSPVDVPPDIAPSVDATAFLNRNRFNINLFNFPPMPYELLHTRFFTNTLEGTIRGSPGFRFDYFNNNMRHPMEAWVNDGEVSGDSWMMAWANTITNTGSLNTGPAGLVRLQGTDIFLTRTGIRAGLTPGTFFSDGFQFRSNYFNAAGVNDVWWGVGTNNALNSGGAAMRLGNTFGGPGTFDVPCTVSPLHQVVDAFRFTNTVTVPYNPFFFGGNCSKQFDAFVYTNTIDATTRVVQVAFVSHNVFDTNFSSRVRFVPDAFDIDALGNDLGRTIMVELGGPQYDIISGEVLTNTIYVIDRSAFTNAILLRPFPFSGVNANARRPSTLEVVRNTPFFFEDTNFVSAGNMAFTPNLIYNSTYQSNAVEVTYAGYRVFIDSTGATNLTGAATIHPTNRPGRVEIVGGTVNLNQTRIRAETTAIIKATNLISSGLAQVDAPFASYDLGSPDQLIVTNLAPPFVQRLSGQISAWSGTWQNVETNAAAGSSSTILFHVLIVDNELQTFTPVTITELALRAPDVIVHDFLNVRDSFFLGAENFHLTGALSLPLGARWSKTNAPNLLNFTNDGSIFISGSALFGSERAGGYENFINRGTNIAAAQTIRANRFENTGCIIANSGIISITANAATLMGGPAAVTTNLFTNAFFNGSSIVTNVFVAVVTNLSGKLQGSSGIEIFANTLDTSKSFIRSGTSGRGGITLSITNRLTDGGPASSNDWTTTAGFRMLRRPSTPANLLGTHLTSRASGNQEVFHTWSADDRGANASGFDNNFALAKLAIAAATNSLFHFSPPSGQSGQALYVDYLEVLDFATNINRVLDIAAGMKIYFASANIPPEKLTNGVAGGRLVWVSDFTGPLSGTNIVYPSPPYPPGTVVRANIALAQSKDIDSDGDGIVNGDDPTPFYINSSAGLAIELSKSGTRFLSWNALAKATNALEYCTNAASGAWNTLTNFVQGNQTTRVTVRDSTSSSAQCIYRARVEPSR